MRVKFCAIHPDRLGPVSDKKTASEWLVSMLFPLVGLSFKARPLFFGMGHHWGRSFLRTFLFLSWFPAVAVILVVLGCHPWFYFFFLHRAALEIFKQNLILSLS